MSKTRCDEEANVGAVILNYNTGEEALACLEAVRAGSVTPSITVVVDNASTQQLPTALTEHRGFRQLPKNLGYAGGMNQGVSAVLDSQPHLDWLWLLNADALPERTCLEEQLAIARTGYVIVAPREIAQKAGGLHATARATAAQVRRSGKLRMVVCDGCAVAAHAAHLVSGGGLLYARTSFTAAGGFDEHFFHYFEEIDLVHRIRATGASFALACQAQLLHEGGAALARRSAAGDYYFTRNQLLFLKKHWRLPLLRLLLLEPRFVWQSVHAMAGRGRDDATKRYTRRAWRDGMAGRGGPL